MYISTRLCGVLSLAALLSACGGSGGEGTTIDDKQSRYAIGGVVSGLGSGTLVLRNTDRVRNTTDELRITGNGASEHSFTFGTQLPNPTPYSVTVGSAPNNLGCSVVNGDGTIQASAVTNIRIDCTLAGYTVSGTVVGLAGAGLELQNNSGDTISIPPTPNPAFTFPTAVGTTNGYAVTILRQPSSPSQTCTVATAGNGPPTGSNITNVIVNCVSNAFTVGGTISGLMGSGLQLQNNSGSTLTIAPGNTAFTFSSAVASGTAYNVTVLTPPGSPTQNCVIAPATAAGIVGNGNVTSVVVNCATNAYTVGGIISGLQGSGLQLRNNNSNTLSIAPGSSTFTFSIPISSGAPYAVTVLGPTTNPAQNCIVAANTASGVISTGDITNVVINCSTNTYTIGGTISGLTGSGLQLRNNGGNTLNVAAGSAAFTFSAPLTSGSPYNVTVVGPTNSPIQNCVVAQGTASGSVGNANVTSVVVNCSSNTFTIGGTISGLQGTGLQLQNNGGSPLTIAAGSSSFTFPTPLAGGASFAVTASGTVANPSQDCVVTPATAAGTVTSTDVNSVAISCTTRTYTIGGAITGLVGTGLQVRNNGGDTLSVAASSTSYVFATRVASGADYSVSVFAQPGAPGQRCQVATANATGRVGSANVTSIDLTCATNTFTIGGTVTGLGSNNSGLELRLSYGTNSQTIPISGDGSFASAPIPSGSAYSVTVGVPHSHYVCTPSNASGIADTANVTSVSIACEAPVRVTVSGVASGTTIQFANTYTLPGSTAAIDVLSITGNQTRSFQRLLPSGTRYVVTISPALVNYDCNVSNGDNFVGVSQVNISVSCVPLTYPVRVTVDGLGASNPGLVLVNTFSTDSGTTSETLPIVGNGTFTFTTPLRTGRTYSIGVFTAHSDFNCANIANATGTMGAAAVVNITVSCQPHTYSIGGSVTGLAPTSTGLRLRRDSPGRASEEVLIDASRNPSPFVFPTELPTATNYTIVEVSEPEDRICAFAGDTNSTSGSINRAAVNSIGMTCALTDTLSITGITSAGQALVESGTGYQLSGPIQIAFSAPLNASTINTSTISLTTAAGSHPISLQVSGNTVTLLPTGGMLPVTPHALTISTQIRGQNKQRMPQSTTRNFTSGTGWTPRALVSQQFADVTQLKVALADNGNAVMLWSEVTGTAADCQPAEFGMEICFYYPIIALRARNFDAASQTWSASATTFFENLVDFGYTLTGFDLGIDAAGNALALWAAYDEGTQVVSLRERRFANSTRTWSNVITIGPSTTASTAMALNGNAWTVVDDGAAVSLRRFTANPADWMSGTWSPPVAATGVLPGSNPQLTSNASGDSYLVWTQDSYPFNLFAARNFTGGLADWSAPAQIGSNSSGYYGYDAAVDSQGNAVVAWGEGAGGQVTILARRNLKTTGWESAPQILISGRAFITGPSVSAGAEGSAIVAWAETIPAAPSNVQLAARILHQGVWGSWQDLGASAFVYPQTTMDAIGDASVIWGDNPGITATRYAGSTSRWSPRHKIDSAPGQVIYSATATNASGNALIIWASGGFLYSSRFVR